MEPTQLVFAALAFAGSAIAQKCADATLSAAWERISGAFREWRGHDASPSELPGGPIEPSEALQAEATTIVGLSSALRRARLVPGVLEGARLLWVDDRPENNAWERSLLATLGVHVSTAETTRSAAALIQSQSFDVIVSDIARPEAPDEGLRALPTLTATGTPVIFYVRQVRSGTPVGAFGLTNDPNELLHLILDSLERSRV